MNAQCHECILLSKHRSFKAGVAKSLKMCKFCLPRESLVWQTYLYHRTSALSPFSAEALQSIIQLMGEKNLHVMFGDSAKVQHIDWTLDAAKTILQAWQRNFTKVKTNLSKN